MLNYSKILVYVMSLTVFSVNAKSDDYVAYLQYTNDFWQVYVKEGDSPSRVISNSSYDKSTVSWLNDGNNIFVCGIQGDAEIINIITGEIKKIKLPYHNINDAVISPDGTKIIYSYIKKDGSNNKLWLYDLKTKVNKPLLKNMGGKQYDPKWSVDSNEFYFVTGQINKPFGISKARIESPVAEPVIKNSKMNLDVDVAANGDLTYSSNIKQNSFNVWIKQNDKITQLINLPGSETHPVWSSSGSKIYFERVVDGVLNIWSIPVLENAKAGKVEQFTFSEHGARYPAIYKKVD